MTTEEAVHEVTARRAYKIYENRMRAGDEFGQTFGAQAGADQDWYEAVYELEQGLPLP